MIHFCCKGSKLILNINQKNNDLTLDIIKYLVLVDILCTLAATNTTYNIN